MKFSLIPQSCRICLRKSKKLRSIYEPGGDPGDKPPNEMLKLLTGIHLDKNNTSEAHLPQCICKSCSLSLNLAFQFRLQALKSRYIISKYEMIRNQKMDTSTNSKNESELKEKAEDLQEFSELHDSLPDDEYVMEDNFVLIEENQCSQIMSIDGVNVLQRKESLDEQETTEPDEEENYEYTEESYLDEIDEIDTASDGLPQITNTERATEFKTEIDTEAQHHQQHTISFKKITLVTDAKRNSKAKNDSKKSEKNGHICDVCGNVFPQRGRMMEHRRRHETELIYQCELCDKRFALREKLRQHLFSHRGGRPFKCSYCSRSFFYKSVRMSHEAIHSGYKPYVCEVCTKPFAYAHSLKKHKLIHADIKLYRCDYCDKDFRLQHHLKQHIDTKLHQNAVNSFNKLTTV